MENNINLENPVIDNNEITRLGFNIEKEKRKQRTKKIVKNVFVYIFLTIMAIISFLPFYWMIITSLKTEMEFRQSVPTFFPQVMKWDNYSFAMSTNSGMFGTALLNTLIVGAVSTILGLIVVIITAYAFAKMNFKGKDLLFGLMLLTMMIPGELFTNTNYMTVGKFGWNNTYIALIAPFLVSVYYIFLLRNNFKQIPDTLYKAAKVDGTGELGFLIKVMIPLTAPTLISITLLKFIGAWNSYIWPELVNKQNDWRLISNWMSGGFTDNLGKLYGGEFPKTEALTTVRMAAACIVSIPLLVLFLFFRKYIMHGISKSGTKG